MPIQIYHNSYSFLFLPQIDMLRICSPPSKYTLTTKHGSGKLSFIDAFLYVYYIYTYNIPFRFGISQLAMLLITSILLDIVSIVSRWKDHRNTTKPHAHQKTKQNHIKTVVMMVKTI